MSYKIRCNQQGNWNGYEGSKRVKEFGRSEEAANAWLHEMHRPKAVSAETLAVRFATKLRQYITPEQYAEVRRRNGTEAHKGCCASHDFCDANMVMLGAYCDLAGVPQDVVDLNTTVGLFNEAWDLALVKYLSTPA